MPPPPRDFVYSGAPLTFFDESKYVPIKCFLLPSCPRSVTFEGKGREGAEVGAEGRGRASRYEDEDDLSECSSEASELEGEEEFDDVAFGRGTRRGASDERVVSKLPSRNDLQCLLNYE